MSDQPCPRHEDTRHRIDVLEASRTSQIEENARIWKAVDLIREEKGKDSVTLEKVAKDLEDFKGVVMQGINDLRNDIMTLKLLPAKRWNDMVSSTIKEIIALGLGALVAYMFVSK